MNNARIERIFRVYYHPSSSSLQWFLVEVCNSEEKAKESCREGPKHHSRFGCLHAFQEEEVLQVFQDGNLLLEKELTTLPLIWNL